MSTKLVRVEERTEREELVRVEERKEREELVGVEEKKKEENETLHVGPGFISSNIFLKLCTLPLILAICRLSSCSADHEHVQMLQCLEHHFM